MLTNLEATIHDIIVSASAGMAREISQAVRKALAAEIMETDGAPPTRAPAKRQGGKRRAAAPAKPKSKPKGALKKGAGRQPHPRRSYDQKDLDTVLGLIKAKPGLRSEQYQAEAKVEKVVLGKVLAKLRADKLVKTEGEKRATTYRVA